MNSKPDVSISDEEIRQLVADIFEFKMRGKPLDKFDLDVIGYLIDHYNSTKELYWRSVDDYELHELPKGRYLLYTPNPDPAIEYRCVDKSMVRVFIDATHFIPLLPPTDKESE